jgi:hypothetical protein
MLSRLVQPMSAAAFLEEVWAERSRHFPAAARSDLFASWRSAEDWPRWLSAADPIDAATRDAAGAQVQTRIVAADAQRELARGATLCADVSRVAAIASELEALRGELRPFAGDPFAKLYVSPPTAGFAMHLDGHHVFVVQLHGSKRWWVGDAPVRPHTMIGGKVDATGRAVHTFPRDGWPLLRADGSVIDAARREDLTQIVLGPGDVLYLPPGTWHTTEAVEQSVALSVSPPRTPLADLVLGPLQGRLDADPRWWQDVVGLAPCGTPTRVAKALRWGTQQLAREVASITAAELELTWARRAFAAVATSPGAPSPARVDPDSTLQPAPGGFVWLRGTDPEDGEPAVFLFRPGVELALPVAAQRFVATLASCETITVAQAQASEPRWSAQETLDLLQGLVDAGVLVVR